jgi:phosphoribosylamine--glycine ligase
MESIDKVVVVDGGARGQAIARKLAGEGLDVVVSPGNPGNENFAVSTGVAPTDVAGQVKAAQEYGADLTIVSADDPLGMGLVDELRARGKTAFGPTKSQAHIESDRKFAKKLATRQGIPIGEYDYFTRKQKKEALIYASSLHWPVFVKDNGLAQGKGALPCYKTAELKQAVKQFKSFVIEASVPGPEASHHAFCDGKTHLPIPFLVRDHKRLENNDRGDMTGGMGVVGPLPSYSAGEVETLGETFVSPVVKELGFQGVLFSGLKGAKGEERLLEWNARPGDPEMQVFLRLMRSELLPVIMACVEGDLADLSTPEWFSGQYAANFVLAAPGYPKKPRQGMLIEGIDAAAETDGVQVLQAGTSRGEDDNLYTAGGRVLNVLAIASSIKLARRQALEAAKNIRFDGEEPVIRSDVGLKTALGY